LLGYGCCNGPAIDTPARALGHGIFTQGETWDELRGNLLEALSLHFDDAKTRPRLVQMHYVKDELIPLEAAGNCRAAYRPSG